MNITETMKHRQACVDAYKTANGCEFCGYNKCPRALCFDHLPGSDKSKVCSSGSRSGGMYKLYHKKYPIEELIEEIEKCRLLCCNCHMESTYTKNKTVSLRGEMTIEELEIMLASEDPNCFGVIR